MTHRCCNFRQTSQGQHRPCDLPENESRLINGYTIFSLSYSVEVSSIDEGGEGDGDSVPQLLLVAQTDLGGVVDLGPDHGPVLQDVLGSNTELGVAVGGAPAQSDSGLQLGAQLLEDGPSEVRPVGEAGVEDHVGGGVAQTEVALSDGRLAQVEAGLVAGKPTLTTSPLET